MRIVQRLLQLNLIIEDLDPEITYEVLQQVYLVDESHCGIGLVHFQLVVLEPNRVSKSVQFRLDLKTRFTGADRRLDDHHKYVLQGCQGY